MTDLNSVTLIGRLTRDGELKYTSGGLPVMKLSLAVNRSVKKGDKWEDEASFFDVTLFGKLGESLQRFLVKGKRLGLTGSLKQDRWEKDVNKQSRIGIIADNIQLLDGGEAKQEQPIQSQQEPTDDGFIGDPIPF